MEKERMPVTNDVIFQRIFGKVGNENITKGFLEKLLGIEIESLTLDTNKRMQGELLDNKTGRLDVKAKLNDGTIVIIEMQVAEYKYMAERMLYYWSMAYIESLNKGQLYEKLHKTIAILISVENLRQTEGIREYHTKWSIKEDNHPNARLTKDLEMHVIELKKFEQRKSESPVDNWIKFIKSRGKEDMAKLTKTDKLLAEAMEEFNNLQDSPEAHEEFLWRQKELRDKMSFAVGAREDGVEEGMEKKQKEVVINMHKKKFDIQTICEITNLTKEEVEKIIEEIK